MSVYYYYLELLFLSFDNINAIIDTTFRLRSLSLLVVVYCLDNMGYEFLIDLILCL